jgi:UrcA family protein
LPTISPGNDPGTGTLPCIIMIFAASAALVLSHSMLATAAPMAGEPETVSVTRIVKYARSGIETAEGATALYAQLRAAAQSACGELYASYEVTTAFSRSGCMSEALDAAVEKVDSSAVTTLHKSKTKSEVVANR